MPNNRSFIISMPRDRRMVVTITWRGGKYFEGTPAAGSVAMYDDINI